MSTGLIQLLIPRPFIVSAQVISCKRFNLRTRIISENRLDYRIHAKFTFLAKGERTLLRDFLEAIQPNLPKEEPRKKIAAEDTEDDIEDFDDLGL